MQVQTVAPEFIYQVWPQVEPFFRASEQYGVGDCTTDQHKLQLASGLNTLIVAVEDGEIKGAAVMAINNLPNHRVAVIAAAGGKGIADKDVLAQVEAWAKLQGATKIRAWAKDSQARLYRQKMGLNTTMHVVEKLL
jgi:hypothetical protein